MFNLQIIQLIVKMAARNILRQRRRSLIVASTAAIGLLCVTLAQGFINGFIHSMLFVAIESGLGHVQIRPPEYINTRQSGLELMNAAKIRKSLDDQLPQNLNYAERMDTEAILRSGSQMQGVVILGLDPDKEKKVSNMATWLSEGSFFDKTAKSLSPHPSGHYECIIGLANAREFELDLNDYIVLTTGRENADSISFRCLISGIFKSPSSSIDKQMVLMRKSQLAKLRFDKADATSYFVFLGEDYKNTNFYKKNITSLISGIEDINVYTYNELEPFISSYFEITDQLTWVIYLIILAGFGIVLFESITMSVFERMHETGIIHAIGARPSFMFWLVMTETLLLTAAGAIINLFGSSIIFLILSYTGVNFEGFSMTDLSWVGSPGLVYPFVNAGNLLMGVGIAGVVSFISGIYPALKAVRMSPVKAIYNR